jgi:hypothetical protein
MAIAKKQRREYLKNQGAYCHFCGSVQRRTENLVHDGAMSISADVECGTCGKTWIEVYALSDVFGEEVS